MKPKIENINQSFEIQALMAQLNLVILLIIGVTRRTEWFVNFSKNTDTTICQKGNNQTNVNKMTWGEGDSCKGLIHVTGSLSWRLCQQLASYKEQISPLSIDATYARTKKKI